jgi:hypothetical protein
MVVDDVINQWHINAARSNIRLAIQSNKDVG